MNYHIGCQLNSLCFVGLLKQIPLLSKMKVVVFFVFLALALFQCHQDVQTQGIRRTVLPCQGSGADNRALLNLLGEGKPIPQKLQVSGPCELDMANKISGDARTGMRFDFQKTCYVVGMSDLVVFVKSKTGEKLLPGSEQCANIPALQAVYLPQNENKITYMILKPGVAPWFFTTKLGGCDVFLATAENKRNNPMAIHSNLNICGNKLNNLRLKGEAVDQMLRVAHDQYLRQYQTNHHGMKTHTMQYPPPPAPATPQFFQCIGRFDQHWKFIVKGETDGITMTQISLL